MAQRTKMQASIFLAIVFAVTIGALLALSIELPDNARTMAYLLAWLTGVVVAFRFGESVFGAVFRRH